jgi:hypothetical protein
MTQNSTAAEAVNLCNSAFKFFDAAAGWCHRHTRGIRIGCRAPPLLLGGGARGAEAVRVAAVFVLHKLHEPGCFFYLKKPRKLRSKKNAF